MSIFGYQSDVIQTVSQNQNTVSLLEIAPQHLNPELTHSPSRNQYTLINENLVLGKDIRLRSATGARSIVGWQVSLPAPLLVNESDYTGTLLSFEGNSFFYAIDRDGRVFLQGTFASSEDEVILNINPYLAEFPIRIRDFGTTPSVDPSDRPSETTITF